MSEDVARYAPTVQLIVLTDRPRMLKGAANVVTVTHNKRSVMGYNDKLCVVANALRFAETCVFLDADTRILAPVDLPPEMFEPGVKAAIVRTWEEVRAEATVPQPQKWQTNNLRIMALLKPAFGLTRSEAQIQYIAEYLFSVTRDGNLDEFLRQWEACAVFCEKNHFFVHEGFSIGLGALKTGFNLKQYEFPWLHVFEPMLAARAVRKGLLSQEEFDALNADIARFKHPPVRWRRLHRVKLAVKALQVELRYLKIRLTGLRLLD